MLDSARPLVAVCERAVQRGVESYLSDDDPPVVTSEDLLTSYPLSLRPAGHGSVHARLVEHEHRVGGKRACR